MAPMQPVERGNERAAVRPIIDGQTMFNGGDGKRGSLHGHAGQRETADEAHAAAAVVAGGQRLGPRRGEDGRIEILLRAVGIDVGAGKGGGE